MIVALIFILKFMIFIIMFNRNFTIMNSINNSKNLIEINANNLAYNKSICRRFSFDVIVILILLLVINIVMK